MKKKIAKIFTFLLAAVSLIGLASCNNNSDITASLKLERSAVNKTFDKNGIEEVKISKYTDGDTSNVKGITSGKTYTVRYLSIDTPESTAGYDKWGKSASLWNKEILSNADSWILEAEGSTPEMDSNGTRYMGYIWYRPKGSETYRLYNLECVENGYSTNNCDSQGRYYAYFQKAEEKAKNAKLKIHGDEVDQYYPEIKTKVSIKDLLANPDTYYNKETDVPTCIELEAYVVSVSTGTFRTATVEQYDKETNKYYQYDIVVGYSGSRFYTITKLNSLIKFIGWTTGEGSLHGCQALAGANDESYYSIVRQADYYNQFSVVVDTIAIENGVMTINGSVAGKGDVVLTLVDSTITEEKIEKFKGQTVKVAKAFAKEKNNLVDYSLNRIEDLSL